LKSSSNNIRSRIDTLMYVLLHVSSVYDQIYWIYLRTYESSMYHIVHGHIFSIEENTMRNVVTRISLESLCHRFISLDNYRYVYIKQTNDLLSRIQDETTWLIRLSVTVEQWLNSLHNEFIVHTSFLYWIFILIGLLLSSVR
jgi:hypothetical protein